MKRIFILLVLLTALFWSLPASAISIRLLHHIESGPENKYFFHAFAENLHFLIARDRVLATIDREYMVLLSSGGDSKSERPVLYVVVLNHSENMFFSSKIDNIPVEKCGQLGKTAARFLYHYLRFMCLDGY